MSERDLPEMGTADEPLSFDEGVADLERLFDSPATDPEESKVQQEAEPDEDDADAESDEGEADPDDDENDEESDDDQEDDDHSEAVTLDDETVITLNDGSQASLADLKRDFGQVQQRVADFQRDYTQKTEALKTDRQEVEKQSERLLQWANEVKQQRDLILSFQQQHIPQPPDPSMMDEDPVGYMKQKAAYEQTTAQMQQIWAMTQQEQHRTQAEQAELESKFLEAEKQKMLEILPELSDPKKYETFRQDLVGVFAPSYGFTTEEIATVRDSRFAKVMRDAISYQKLKASQSETRAKIANKPPVLQSGKSLSAKGKQAKTRQSRAETLRKTGSLEAGINALMDLDL